MASSAEKTTLIFSFGSNSTAQLRARLNLPELTSTAAYLRGWQRVFVKPSVNWGGAVASIHPDTAAGARTYGAVVALTAAQVAAPWTPGRGPRLLRFALRAAGELPAPRRLLARESDGWQLGR